MACDPVRVTGYVDEALPPAAAAQVESHLALCPDCRRQAAEERSLRRHLRALVAPEPPPGLDARVLRRIRRTRLRRVRRWASVAAAFALAAAWTVTSPSVLAWAVARDHAHCLSFGTLPVQIQSSDPEQVARWVRQRGSIAPWLPRSVGTLKLLGARHCRLADLSRAVHVYYTDGSRHLSLYLLRRPLPLGPLPTMRESGGDSVRLLPLREGVAALVGATEDVEAFAWPRR